MIRTATRDDVGRLVEIHQNALPEDLLPRLGPAFLSDAFYEAALRERVALTVVGESGGVVNAFCVFATPSSSLAAEIAARKGSLLLALLRRAWRHPGLLGDLLPHLKGTKTEILDPKFNDLGQFPEIYVIATDPREQGRGLGARVMKYGLLRIFQTYAACVVRTSSPRARTFYLRHGFRLIGAEYRGSRRLDLLAIDRGPPEALTV